MKTVINISTVILLDNAIGIRFGNIQWSINLVTFNVPLSFTEDSWLDINITHTPSL